MWYLQHVKQICANYTKLNATPFILEHLGNNTCKIKQISFAHCYIEYCSLY